MEKEATKSRQTRRQLVDTARLLFAERGVSNITMNDVAEAAHRSRRTIYSYFQSKEDIYHAVIEEEANILLQHVMEVKKRNLPPKKRITEYIVTHLDAVKTAVERNGGLHSDFFSNVKEVTRARLRVDIREQALLQEALQEGIRSGDFKPMNVELTATLIFAATRGVEIPYIRNFVSNDFNNYKHEIVRFILSCLDR